MKFLPVSSKKAKTLKKHLDDDEFLDVIKMPIKEVITKIMTNEIKDSKTIAAVFKLKELMNL